MKIKAMDMIERLDMLEPNDYAPEQKLRWLSALDGKIYREVIRTHEGGNVWPGPYVRGDEELIVPLPYGEDIYYHYPGHDCRGKQRDAALQQTHDHVQRGLSGLDQLVQHEPHAARLSLRAFSVLTGGKRWHCCQRWITSTTSAA